MGPGRRRKCHSGWRIRGGLAFALANVAVLSVGTASGTVPFGAEDIVCSFIMTGLSTPAGTHRYWELAVILIFSLMGLGCSTASLPTVDLAQPGWAVQRMEAVWTPRRGAPELTGEVIIANHDTEGRLVLFSKQGLPMVTARSAANRWTLASPLKRGVYGGRGLPPRQVPWFLLTCNREIQKVSKPWTIETTSTGWQISNPSTGEKLEVVP